MSVGAYLADRRPSLVVKEILAALPDPADTPLAIDATDRGAVRCQVAAKLRGRPK